MYNVLIVEDHSLVAEAAAHKIANSPHRPLIEVRSTADEALTTLRADAGKFDLILLDLDVPGAFGLSLAAEIVQLGLAPRTCVLTGAERPDFEARIAELGFQGYLLKGGGTSIAMLEEDLLRIVAGEKVFRSASAPDSSDLPHLTSRQAQCLAFAASGLTTKEIARELGLHPGTVDRCIHGASMELGCTSRTEATARALELGFIALPTRGGRFE